MVLFWLKEEVNAGWTPCDLEYISSRGQFQGFQELGLARESYPKQDVFPIGPFFHKALSKDNRLFHRQWFSTQATY
jgi:hypothetical protein